MARYYLKSAISFTCILLISSDLAMADITHYIDADGITTYTDSPHEGGDDKVQASIQEDTTEANILSASRQSKSEDWATKHLTPRSVPLDVETMKAAKLATLVLDQAAPTMRHKEFIAYDQRNQGWFDFR